MKERNRQLKKYYRSVRSWLPCSRKLKNRILGQIGENISAYLEDHPSAAFADIQQRFGGPQQIAAAYVEEMDSAELLRDLRVHNRIVRIVIACAAAVIVIWGASVTVAVIEHKNAVNGYYEIGEITTLNPYGDLR